LDRAGPYRIELVGDMRIYSTTILTAATIVLSPLAPRNGTFILSASDAGSEVPTILSYLATKVYIYKDTDPPLYLMHYAERYWTLVAETK
jgi:hypothetical protein